MRSSRTCQSHSSLHMLRPVSTSTCPPDCICFPSSQRASFGTAVNTLQRLRPRRAAARAAIMCGHRGAAAAGAITARRRPVACGGPHDPHPSGHAVVCLRRHALNLSGISRGGRVRRRAGQLVPCAPLSGVRKHGLRIAVASGAANVCAHRECRKVRRGFDPVACLLVCMLWLHSPR